MRKALMMLSEKEKKSLCQEFSLSSEFWITHKACAKKQEEF